MAHIHNIKDAETHFIINTTTREISNAGELPALAKGDHNSEVFTFVVNRYVDGHDLTTCNKVKVHYLNIESGTRKTYADIYRVEDMHADETDSTKVVFTWLISKYATQYAGLLNFAIHFNCETDGVIDYSWKTAAFTGITVKNSVDSTEQLMTEYTDILEKWKQDIIKDLAQSGTGHTHDNKNTLDGFWCEALDNPKTDGDFNFGVNNEDYNRLKFNGGTLLFNTDGAVIPEVRAVEIDGHKFFRMYLRKPGLVADFEMPNFIDIPVNDVEDKFDIGSNGIGLVLPTSGSDDFISRDEWSEETSSIDSRISFNTMLAESALKTRTEVSKDTQTLAPDRYYDFGEAESLTLDFEINDELLVYRNEYSFTFISGATPTVLTLPDTVKWANELTIEANKRYEISIVDNIGLWCAVEVDV